MFREKNYAPTARTARGEIVIVPVDQAFPSSGPSFEWQESAVQAPPTPERVEATAPSVGDQAIQGALQAELPTPAQRSDYL